MLVKDYMQKEFKIKLILNYIYDFLIFENIKISIFKTLLSNNIIFIINKK